MHRLPKRIPDRSRQFNYANTEPGPKSESLGSRNHRFCGSEVMGSRESPQGCS